MVEIFCGFDSTENSYAEHDPAPIKISYDGLDHLVILSNSDGEVLGSFEAEAFIAAAEGVSAARLLMLKEEQIKNLNQ